MNWIQQNFLKWIVTGAAILSLGGGTLAEAAKPNIVLIMVDDMGFSDISCYGGEIPTPHIDALAAGGLRFTHFYNCTRCSPTRASLLTGRYNYRGNLTDNCVTIAEVLKPAGYFTIQTGKWHVGSRIPQWPAQRGFDRNYTVPQGGGFYFRPIPGADGKPRIIVEGNTILYRDGGAQPPPGWYTTDAFADYGIKYIGEALTEKKPFFLYLAFNAPHFPLQAPPEDIARFRGKYRKGWDKLREERHARQIEMGIVDKKWPRTPRDARVKAWDELSAAEKNEQDERMAIYAAVVSRMDRAVGRVVDYLKKQGVYENTLILFLSDNGGCNAGGLHGSNAKPGVPGTHESYVYYGSCWANASNTPFRLYKKWVHEGGIATPLIAHWPAVIQDGGKLTGEVGHVIDLMATCADVGGAEYPRTFKGEEIPPLEGLSLAPIFRAGKREGHDAIFWAHDGNYALRSGKWKLVLKAGGPWELYDIEADRTELHDLAAQFPDKVKALAAKWEAWAERTEVKPFPAKPR